MSARDMAKFGVLYLNDGQHNGEQIVPAEYRNYHKLYHFLGIGLCFEFWQLTF